MDPHTVPALAPPEGVAPNLVNPPTLIPEVVGTAASVLALTTGSVVARAFVRLRVLRGHHAEDWLSYGAWAGLANLAGLVVYTASSGYARHPWDISVAQRAHIAYYMNVMACVYAPTALAAKLSVLFQIKRIFTVHPGDSAYWVSVVSIGVNAALYTGLFFSWVFQCWPRARIWDPNVPGKCISMEASDLASGILNLVSDIGGLLLPLWAIWHLSTAIKGKLAAYAVFGVGFL